MMNKQWQKQDNLFLKETDDKFLVIGYTTFYQREENTYIYSPTLHSIDKRYYPLESIEDITSQMFVGEFSNMSLAKKIIHLSVFIGSCEDLFDENAERINFEFREKEATELEITNLISAMIDILDL